MDPRAALNHFEKFLTEYERSEILDYDTIYWLDVEKRKKLKKPPATPSSAVDNNGFDNDKQEYICSEGEHIAYRFEILSNCGKGCFG